MKTKKKKVNEGIRNISKNFVEEKKIEDNIKLEIAKEINITKKKD